MKKLTMQEKDKLGAVYEDLKLALIHEEIHTLGVDDIEALCDLLDKVMED